MWQKLINASEKWVPILIICKMSMTKTWHIKCSYNFSNSSDLQLYLQDSTSPWTTLPHRTPVALFWDLFRGLHLTSWRWMACRRINYPHDLLGVSETLQPDYPRLQLITAGAPLVRCQNIYNYLQLLWTLTFNHRGPSLLKNCKNPRGTTLFKASSICFQTCSVMGYQHLAKLCRMMGCSATLLKPHLNPTHSDMLFLHDSAMCFYWVWQHAWFSHFTWLFNSY